MELKKKKDELMAKLEACSVGKYEGGLQFTVYVLSCSIFKYIYSINEINGTLHNLLAHIHAHMRFETV